jgi:hypothetical protein
MKDFDDIKMHGTTIKKVPVLLSYKASLLGVVLFHFAVLCHFPIQWLANLRVLLPNYLRRNGHTKILRSCFPYSTF